ncbi:MAG: hypothetical protein CVV64_05945 [Candidatus Wallbacteria bacterium HGW-Wallbacteria-1]|jgi:serine phosphatase RsbU (regulator of sigma subunit)|uniref:Uncharacterized protein n=1 Tax=Candidatus Wallbacteria bacterium HGW-Wallbacteria-1 TaxID=2013854 RepID=A0A2N1PSI6_9BACT|nr:MAG: hypothetical protein CVV64_05945 [Candidatus Wallbacteria bacterium HGW-Wallbacteria-1]
MDDTVTTGGKDFADNESEPENLIRVDFRNGISHEISSSWETGNRSAMDLENEIERLRMVAKRHNSVLRTLYGIVTDLMTSMDSRIENLEQNLEPNFGAMDTGIS